MSTYNNQFIESKLPKPMDKEEFVFYYHKMKLGDKEARAKIIIHNLKLVFKEVSIKFINAPYEYDELVSVGIIGLIKSVDKYDILRNVEFSTFAVKVIDNEILVYMRKNKKNLGNLSIYYPLNIDAEGNELSIQETLVDDNIHFTTDYENRELISELMEIIEKFPTQNKKILKLYFGFYDGEKHTQKEIAQLMNISQSCVSKTLQNDLKKIRNLYKNYRVNDIFKEKIKNR